MRLHNSNSCSITNSFYITYTLLIVPQHGDEGPADIEPVRPNKDVFYRTIPLYIKKPPVNVAQGDVHVCIYVQVLWPQSNVSVVLVWMLKELGTFANYVSTVFV